MAQRITMPKQGNTVEAVILLEWKKNEGDPVEEGDTLCEVETDKATFEVPSTAGGVLLKKLYGEGDEVPVMQEFAVVGASDEQLEDEGEPAPSSSQETGQAEKPPSPTTEKPSYPTTEARAETQVTSTTRPEGLTGKRSVRISPLARRTAETQGIPESRYGEISGSGPRGRILKRDVEAFGERPASDQLEATAAEPTGAPEAPAVAETVPVTGVRKVISQRMLQSLTQTAQLTLNATANATQLVGYRGKLKTAPESLGVSDISLNDILMFIVSRTLMRHPALNAHYTEGEPDEIRRFSGVNLGFAVDAEKGLYVPVIHGADRMSLRRMANRAHELAEKVHAGKAGPPDLDGATFTVTNLGALGVRDFTPVLDPPQVAILGVGTIRPEQTYRGDDVVTAPHIGLSLTFDHRAVDGGPAARLLQDIAAGVANAETVLAL